MIRNRPLARDWRLEIEMPGMEEHDLEVLVGNGELTLRGEKKVEREETGRDYYLRERVFGRFPRSYDLPDGRKLGRTTADYRNGVLTITIPKTAGAKSAAHKKFPIEAP